jgi:hypothetical protein
MDARLLTRLLLPIFVCGSFNSICRSQQDRCQSADTPREALSCVLGVSPISIHPLTSGVPYVSVTDQMKTPYSTYLYPHQSNEIPAQHQVKGKAIAATIRPLDKNGNVDLVNGKIAVIAEGMSNTRIEMEAFENLFIQGNPVLHQKLEFRNLSQGGCDLVCWVEKGVASIDRQVQVALVKHSNNRHQHADGTPQSEHGPFKTRESKFFPSHALVTKDQLKQRILNLKKQYPNLKLVYLTSRTFGGWSCEPAGNEYREPVAFEEGFSVKWLVEDQVLGRNPELAFEGSNAPAPWLAWGPYLWDPTWTQDMYRDDGIHPCDRGATLVAQMWYDFLKNESTAWPWFLKAVPTTVEDSSLDGVSLGSSLQLFQNFPNPFNAQTEMSYFMPANGEMKLTIYDMRGRDVRTLVQGIVAAGVHKVQWDGTDNHSNAVPSGIYLYQLKTGQVTLTRTLTLLK